MAHLLLRPAVLALATLAVAGSAIAEEPAAPKTDQDRLMQAASEAAVSLASRVEAGDKNAVVATATDLANEAIDYTLGSLTEGLPAWAGRIEMSAQVDSEGKPSWSILTVQPLYQSDEERDTLFTQISQQRYDYLGETRDVTNLGLGYRRILGDQYQVLIGANAFFDYEWERQHRRFGGGVEAKWTGLDFYANKYVGVGGLSGTGLSGDTQEEVLDGMDAELGAQLPYLPWARVFAKYYEWDSNQNAEDVEGFLGSVEMDIHQNLTVEAGFRDDNFQDREEFAKLTFKLGNGEPGEERPVALSSAFLGDQIWTSRDMRAHTLDKVRRENRIIVDRVSSGVVITRSN